MAEVPRDLPLNLARFFLRALGAEHEDRLIEHVRSGGVEFLFLRPPKGLNLEEKDRDAIAAVIEAVAHKAGLAVVVDWK